jgi:hypothetical protein
VTCDTCGQNRLTGDLRWHGREAKWHCSTCLPAAGGSPRPPGLPPDRVMAAFLAVATAVVLAGLYALKFLVAPKP